MATLSSVWRDIKSKHFRIAESSGSIGIIGILALLVVAVLLFVRKFLGKFSTIVAFIIACCVPVFGL